MQSKRNNITYKKLFCVVLCALLFISQFIYAQQTNVLDKKITITIKNKSVADALKQIETQEGVFFSYNPSAIKTATQKTKSFTNKSLRSVLNQIFEEYKVYYQAKGTVIYIRNQARKGKLKGKITDNNGNPIPFASVVLKSATYGASSNENGKYKFSAPEGNHILVVSTLGYKNIERNIVIRPNKTEIQNFTLQEAEQELEEITVRGKTKSQVKREEALHVNSIELKKLANTTLNLNQVLNRTSGVKVREQGGVGSDFNFSINGLSGNAVRFFIDGVPMEAMGSVVNLSNVPVNLAKRIEVFKGVVPVTLGSDALGGAVNIVTNKGIDNYIDASYSYGSFNTHKSSLNAQWRHKTGFTVRANAFLNYSDNNYTMKGVEVFNTNTNNFEKGNYERFHDAYLSVLGQVELGVTNKKWTDAFFIGTTFSKEDKEIQTGAVQDQVYGGGKREGNANGFNLRYKKDSVFFKNLNVNFYASHVKDNFKVIDTTFKKFEWNGNFTNIDRGEMFGQNRSIFKFERPKTIARLNTSYKLNKQHHFNVNYNVNHLKNRVYDTFGNIEDTEDAITKHFIGLAYQQHFFDKKLSNTFFTKYFITKFDTEQKPLYFSSGNASDPKDKTYNWGFGIASRYKFKNFGVKVSYESTFRLQSANEFLGDGTNVIPNFALKPENSDNINIGAFWGNNYNKHTFFIEGAWFYRNVKDYIFSVVIPEIQKNQFQNTSSVKVDGFETEFRYSYDDLLNFSVNASYQNAINKSPGEVTHNNRIPNQPWFFGNVNLGIGKNDVLGKGTRLQFDWNSQYVQWFYLTWEGFGNTRSKATIPNQYIHNAVVSYSLKNGKYNIALEAKNITDNLTFDNYKLQKPGRAFSIKLRAFIN